MKDNNKAIIRKIAQKSLTSNLGRNIFLTLAIFMTTFMNATIISLCVNQIETQRLYSAQYFGMVDNEIEPIIYVLAMMVILLVIDGSLLIYNVMSVSVSRDIRFYGLLRTIGMLSKQVKRMVLQQILWICAVGIPLGLFFSGLISQIAVPMFLSMYTKFSLAGYSISFHPLIYIGAAFFSLITAMTGAFRPAWKAARVSPMEAVRFSEYGYIRKKIHTSAFSPIKMAWRNVFRVPKQTTLVFCGLFLGITIFMAVSVILGSTSVDMFVKEAAANIKGDIYLKNGMQELYEFDDINVFTPELMNSLNELPGVTEMRVSYIHKIRMDIADTQGDIHNLPGYVYGVDAKGVAELNKELEHPIDEAAFERGEFVIIRDIWKDPLSVADTVDFYIGNMETPVSFALGGVLPSEFVAYYGTGYNRIPSVYMSVSLLKKLVGEPAVYEIEIDIERSVQKQALSLVNKWTAGHSNIILRSGIEIQEEAENIIFTLTVIGNCISAIFWLTGVLNFINIIIASILSRRHELALLESVGQSARQSKRMLIYEGLIYASVTLLLVGAIGGVITYGLFSFLSQQFEYIKFTFPFSSFFMMVFVVFAICLGIPRLAYYFVSRATIVERLREAE